MARRHPNPDGPHLEGLDVDSRSTCNTNTSVLRAWMFQEGFVSFKEIPEGLKADSRILQNII